MEQQDTSIIMFNMLPISVRSRLPALQSFRWSASLSVLPSRRPQAPLRPDSGVKDGAVSTFDDTAVVKLPSRFPADLADSAVIDDEIPIHPVTVSEDRGAPVRLSGIKWRYATQGSYLHHSAAREKDDPVFTRKSYIDGVAYMLKALPSDLDDYESSVIRRALPNSCETGAPHDNHAPLAAPPRRTAPRGPPPADEGATLLHRGVAALVSRLVVIAHALLSCAVVVIRAGAQYERRHSVSQHLFSRGLVLAAAAGRRIVVLSARVCAMGDGRVGRAVSDFAAWAVESVTGGIQDGIGRGIWAVEEKRRWEVTRKESGVRGSANRST